MKAKIHKVEVCNLTVLAWAQTRQGAIRDTMEHLKSQAEATVATGEEIYSAGQRGVEIIGADRYKNMHDPNQIDLPGVTIEGDK